MRSILVDTGAIVGLLRANDRHHGRAKEFFAALRPTDVLLTTWPVITECAFIMRHQETAYWDWLLDSEIQVVEFALDDVPSMRSWRKHYEDREVDFADASLVWLANERRTQFIATTDFDDFATYRLPSGKPFNFLIKRPL
jgi:predicted nucleic acid-binding protein